MVVNYTIYFLEQQPLVYLMLQAFERHVFWQTTSIQYMLLSAGSDSDGLMGCPPLAGIARALLEMEPPHSSRWAMLSMHLDHPVTCTLYPEPICPCLSQVRGKVTKPLFDIGKQCSMS